MLHFSHCCHRLAATLFSLSLCGLVSGTAQAQPSGAVWPPKSYAIYYGAWDLPTLQQAQEFGCVIFHPGSNFSNISPEMVRKLRAGKDGQIDTADDVWAIAYVSIGEDEHVPSGPLRASKEPLSGPTVRQSGGTYGPARKGYPSKYLDEMCYVFDSEGYRKFGENGKPQVVKGHDGIPDENGVWGSFYTYAGDAGWQKELVDRFEQIRSANGAQKEDLVDGFFLDTLDTASPWGNYGDTQSQMANLLEHIRKSFPRQKIVANRGMFLIDKHGAQYNRSVDAVLFESMYTIWDWARGVGIISPWCRGDYGCFRDQLYPAAQKASYQVLFVNYLNPKQSDFVNLLKNSSDLIAGRGLEYISDPGLQKLYPPFSQVLPASSAPAPILGGLSVQELGSGRYRISGEITGLGERALGKDYFLDVRLSKDALTGLEPSLVSAVPFDDRSLKTVNLPDGKLQFSLESFGMDKATNYNIYVRGLESTRSPASSPSPYLSVSLKSADHPAPAMMEEIQAQGLDGCVVLSWKNSSLTAKRFRIYQGSSPSDLKPVAEIDRPTHRIPGLRNGQGYYFSVAGLDSKGQEGVLSLPVGAHPEDCTPPANIAGTTARSSTPGEVVVEWTKSSADTKTIKVYLAGAKENYRIPARVSADLTRYEFKAVPPGEYWAAVAAVDANANETPRPQRVKVSVK